MNKNIRTAHGRIQSVDPNALASTLRPDCLLRYVKLAGEANGIRIPLGRNQLMNCQQPFGRVSPHARGSASLQRPASPSVLPILFLQGIAPSFAAQGFCSWHVPICQGPKTHCPTVKATSSAGYRIAQCPGSRLCESASLVVAAGLYTDSLRFWFAVGPAN